MRAFLALDLDEPFLRGAAVLGARLRPHARLAGARWVAGSVMHVTLRFLGETDEALVPVLAALVAKLGEGRPPIGIDATSLLAFPHQGRAHVLGLDIGAPGDALDVMAALAAEAERAVVGLGLPPESRVFRPHLTLARLRRPTDLRDVVGEPFEPFGGYVTSITLYRSVTGPSGPTYTSLARSVLEHPDNVSRPKE